MPLSITHDGSMQHLLQALAALGQPWLPQKPHSGPQTEVGDGEDGLDISLDYLHHLGVEIVGWVRSETSAAHHTNTVTKAKYGMIYL